jgi:hypothetical protein
VGIMLPKIIVIPFYKLLLGTTLFNKRETDYKINFIIFELVEEIFHSF